MSLETAVDELALQTTTLLDVVVALNSSISGQIAAAVLASENEMIIPFANSVTNLITTQTLLINILNK
jgi:hypothetical protein